MTNLDPMIQRMIGALRLDDATYEAVEADENATGQAAYIIVATSLVSGAVQSVRGGPAEGLFGAIGALIGWAFYAWVAYLVGVKLFPGKETKSSWGELARTLGFANTPRFALIFQLVPGFAGATQTVVALWVLLATIVALRTALDVSPGRAIFIGIASGFGQFIIIFAAIVVASALIPM